MGNLHSHTPDGRTCRCCLKARKDQTTKKHEHFTQLHSDRRTCCCCLKVRKDQKTQKTWPLRTATPRWLKVQREPKTQKTWPLPTVTHLIATHDSVMRRCLTSTRPIMNANLSFFKAQGLTSQCFLVFGALAAVCLPVF